MKPKIGDFVFFRWGDANAASEWSVDHPELASAWALGQVTFFGKMKLYNKWVTGIAIAAVGDTGQMKNLQIAIPWSWVEKDSIILLPDLLSETPISKDTLATEPVTKENSDSL